MKRSTESEILKSALELLRLKGAFCWRSNNTGVRRRDKSGREFWAFNGTLGVSDIIGVLPGGSGRIITVETKAPGKKPTPHQSAFLAAIEAMGGLSLVVDDVKQLESILRDLE